MITRTHNAYHLGDNLIHLHFLRKVALANPDRQFEHAAQWQYLKQLQDVVSDIPNIKLTDFNYRTPSDSIDAWRGTNGFWYGHPLKNDFVMFHVEAWFPHLAKRIGVENPIVKRRDMLFDYPAILDFKGRIMPACEILVINSAPGSGQWQSYDQYALSIVADALSANGTSVVVTNDFPKNLVSTKRLGYSVTQIGGLSLQCKMILMVSTGPSWPTFNVWNQDSIKLRVILSDAEELNLAPNTVHCATIDEAQKVLKERGLL